MEIDPDKFRIRSGKKVQLSEFDPESTDGFKGDHNQAKGILEKLTIQLDDLQERLYAEHKHSLLIVLQGMDTSGKDGTVEHVFEGVNPQGVRVANFKAPTAQELDHDFLWRVHQKTPGKGEIVIFNRSHYEDVLIVRVHDLVPEKVWRKRYGHINDFERLLSDAGTTILKFYLNISEDEQKKRLLDRLDQPDKHWKFNSEDLNERKYWNDYQKAYEDALAETSTEWAPWYIVPANHKWLRNLVIASILVKTLQGLNPRIDETLSEKDIEKYRAVLQEK